MLITSHLYDITVQSSKRDHVCPTLPYENNYCHVNLACFKYDPISGCWKRTCSHYPPRYKDVLCKQCIVHSTVLSTTRPPAKRSCRDNQQISEQQKLQQHGQQKTFTDFMQICLLRSGCSSGLSAPREGGKKQSEVSSHGKFPLPLVSGDLVLSTNAKKLSRFQDLILFHPDTWTDMDTDGRC